MRPLTDVCPKPLCRVHGKPLMQWSIEALARGGFGTVVVNTAWLEEQIRDYFGARFPIETSSQLSQGTPASNIDQVQIRYSHEGRDFGGALETAGGIVRVLPQLQDVFWLLAGDVFAPDFMYAEAAVRRFASSSKLAHLWLVPNPPHHPDGDFGLAPGGTPSRSGSQLVLNRAEVQYTYSTIGLYRRGLFGPPYCDIPSGNPLGIKARLGPILRAAIEQEQVSAELYTGAWTDVGTPQRLAQLNNLPLKQTQP